MLARSDWTSLPRLNPSDSGKTKYKLAVGESDDAYEREANDVGERATRIALSRPPNLNAMQRKCAGALSRNADGSTAFRRKEKGPLPSEGDAIEGPPGVHDVLVRPTSRSIRRRVHLWSRGSVITSAQCGSISTQGLRLQLMPRRRSPTPSVTTSYRHKTLHTWECQALLSVLYPHIEMKQHGMRSVQISQEFPQMVNMSAPEWHNRDK